MYLSLLSFSFKHIPSRPIILVHLTSTTGTNKRKDLKQWTFSLHTFSSVTNTTIESILNQDDVSAGMGIFSEILIFCLKTYKGIKLWVLGKRVKSMYLIINKRAYFKGENQSFLRAQNSIFCITLNVVNYTICSCISNR